MAVLGAAVLAGWWLEIPRLLSPVPGLPTMMPTTALSLLVGGISLALLTSPAARSQRAGRVGAAVLVGLSVAAIVERALGVEVHLLFDGRGDPSGLRPAPNTIACLGAIGGALLALDWSPRWRWRPADVLAVIAGVLATAALLGYVYGATALYRGPSAPLGVGMAAHTGIALLVLVAGVLLARPDVGVMGTITSSYAGGMIARRLLLVALAIPAVGVVVQLGRRFGLYDPPVAIALVTTLATLLSGLWTLETARWLDRADREREVAAGAARRLASVVESADDAIFARTTDGLITSWNPAAERMYGYAAHEAIGRADLVVPPDRSDELAQLSAQVARGERVSSHETDRVRRDGSRFPVSLTMSPILDAHGAIVGVSTIARDISARRAIEDALRRNQEQLRALFQQASDGIFVADIDGRCTDVNDAGCALLGFSCDELLQKTIPDLIPAEDVPRLAEARERLRAGEIDVSEWMLRARDGTTIPVEVSAKILRDGRVQASVRDIRERKAAQEALQRASETERRLRDELERVLGASGAVTDALAELRESDLSIVLQTIAHQAQGLTHAGVVAVGIGTDPEVPFDPWVTIGVPDEVARAIGRTPRPIGTLGVVARGGETVRTNDVRAHPAYQGTPPHHPEIRSFLSVPIRYAGRSVGNLFLANKVDADAFDESDERCIRMVVSRVGAAIEIATAYAAERRQRAWTQAILEQMPDGVIVVGERGDVVLRNRAAMRLARDHPAGDDEKGSMDSYDVRAPDGTPVSIDAWPLTRAFGRGESTIGLELALVASGDEWVPVLASATPVRVGPRIVGAVLVLHDIRPLKELERLREEWGALVAHDLRQPLNLLAMSSALLPRLHQGAMPEAERRAIEKISGAVRSLDRMVSDLLDSSRIEARRLTVETRDVELVQLVRETIEASRGLVTGHDVELVSAEPLWVAADAGRIEQVMANLLSNAAKYGTPGSAIRVEVVAHERDGEVVVTNRGPGISREDLPRLFSRFVRTGSARASDVPGTGLGLYIAKGLITAHRGCLWAESVPGDTTSFHFTLPRVAR